MVTELSWPSEATRQALARAGWTPGRQVDIGEWVGDLTAQGYYFSELAKEILKSFGGLAIRPVDVPEAIWAADPIVFDPVEAGDGMYQRYKPQEVLLGHRMAPLASWGGESTILMLDDGKVVSDSSFGLQLLGNTFPEALDLALRRYRKPDVLVDY
jgi:hypothetical protein